MPNFNHVFDIVNGTEKSEYTEFDPRLISNMFLVSHPASPNVASKALFPTPGLNLEAGATFNLGGTNAGGRGTYLHKKNEGYVVFKNAVYKVNSVGGTITHSFIANINTETGYVGIAGTEKEIIFVDGVNGWLLDLATLGFTELNLPGFPSSPIDVVVFGDRFIVIKGETKLIHYSGINDGLDWPPLNFFSLDSNDIGVGLGVLNGRLYIMGTTIIEPWYNAGAPTLPFRPQLPSFEFGCAGVGSTAKGFGILAWLSRTDKGGNAIVALTGGLPKGISNEALNRELNSYQVLDDAFAFIYQDELGHVKYRISFTAENKSWMYDFNTGAWSQLESEGNNRHRGNNYIFLGRKHFVLDYSEPKMYEMSVKYHSDEGKVIPRKIVSPHFIFPNAVALHGVKLLMKQGVGSESGQDEDPRVKLRLSLDGGNSFGNEIEEKIGKIGRYTQNTEIYKLGISDSFIFEITFYNQVAFMLFGLLGSLGGAR